MSADKGGRGVFIGNIPYGLTEDQIRDICATVGQVISFRLVYDSDTGRPKGFGFAEFTDADAAASAVRNLDKFQIGGRELRVDYSHVGSKDPNPNATNNPNTFPLNANPAFNSADPNNAAYNPPGPPSTAGQLPNQRQQQNPGVNPILGPLPTGAELPPNLTCPDAISKTLDTLPAPQLLDILSQMKNLVANDPARATELLRQAPQLSYAIFQALLLMNCVDTSLIASLVESPAAAPQAASQQQQGMHPIAQHPGPPGPLQQQQAAYGGTPVGMGVPPPQQQVQFPPGQEGLIRQLLAMPQSEIDKLSPQERGQIMALKAQYAGIV